LIQFVQQLIILLDDFLADDLDESVADPSERHGFLPDDRVSATEARELEARVKDFAKDSAEANRYDVDVVPQHLLVPTDSDPGVWAVRVKVRHRTVHKYSFDNF
jgi:hypothetical protein